ncbi:uncharacterized protein MONBRDRAFT_29176 [Monosiga brevicollis MX1]|uniref:Uncharacterized protein n=1 Tax=Monosiga brevicollis TaxID=81824 RepID=A9VAC0_MONBE|nr:uncharacterized protein MONBRDRAFT_29176 [Monosiga brevicollis MX1]EDQ85459.1 predicted protein [Monosiga brevicollis MX1]|eukprot:XP_001749650.1 hypothetical protein [Monosiga brevicollis MX1]
MTTLRAKVALVGPAASGKTILANFLADHVTDGLSMPYRPTQGCRILETTMENHSDTALELWDVSGDINNESGWPAITTGLDGVIVVFDINQTVVDGDLDIWFRRFIKRPGVKSNQVLVFANNPHRDSATRSAVDLTGPLSKAKLVLTDVTREPEAVRAAFNALMTNVRSVVEQRRDDAERKVLGM